MPLHMLFPLPATLFPTYPWQNIYVKTQLKCQIVKCQVHDTAFPDFPRQTELLVISTSIIELTLCVCVCLCVRHHFD